MNEVSRDMTPEEYAEMVRQTRELDAEIDAVLNEPERVAARKKRQAARGARRGYTTST